MVTYVAKFDTPTSIMAHTRPGAQLEPYSSGLGKVLLSALPQSELDNFIHEGELVALTPHTITDRALLLAELEAVRRKGFALDDRESRTDLCCVAVPIRDNEGRIIAAMSASERADDMTPARQNDLRMALFDAAAALQRKMYPESTTLDARRARPVMQRSA
jgi:DNA-binding IclR family transcriptional regulator